MDNYMKNVNVTNKNIYQSPLRLSSFQKKTNIFVFHESNKLFTLKQNFGIMEQNWTKHYEDIHPAILPVTNLSEKTL